MTDKVKIEIERLAKLTGYPAISFTGGRGFRLWRIRLGHGQSIDDKDALAYLIQARAWQLGAGVGLDRIRESDRFTGYFLPD